MCNTKGYFKSLVPFNVIVNAKKGDTEAIAYILNHYGPYIAKLSKRDPYFERSNAQIIWDEEIRERLETKLITLIFKFEIR